MIACGSSSNFAQSYPRKGFAVSRLWVTKRSESRARSPTGERVAFDRARITSRDWSSYPILRFTEVPDEIRVQVVNQPGAPFLGTGEAAQGPTAAAIANAIADATGARLREIPLKLLPWVGQS